MNNILSSEFIVGKMNYLRIHRDSPHGFYLISQNNEEILLPTKYKTDTMSLNDILHVFIYTDSDDRPVATTEVPSIFLNQVALLTVVDKTSFGAFVNIGLPKDLLIPKSKQKKPFSVGDKRFIKLILDKETNRLIGTEKLQLLNKDCYPFNHNTPVDILIYQKTPLGFKVIINHQYEGLLFHNEIFEPLTIGDKKKAYIKKIRSDGKIDLSLQPIGSEFNPDFIERIIFLLDKNQGFLPYTYKSNPEIIQKVFSMSKKNFKKSLTHLIKTEKIILGEKGIEKSQIL